MISNRTKFLMSVFFSAVILYNGIEIYKMNKKKMDEEVEIKEEEKIIERQNENENNVNQVEENTNQESENEESIENEELEESQKVNWGHIITFFLI